MKFLNHRLPPLFIIGALTGVMLISTARAGSPASPTGLFEGVLLRDIGNEPITMQFDRSGGMRVISALELTERESTGIGIWKNVAGGQQEFGYISYREGSEWLCVEFDPTAPPADCTLVVTGRFVVDKDDMLWGTIVITVKDRTDSGDNYTIGPIPIELRRVSIEDLQSIHE